MADELAYGSNKRKYEDSPPHARRPSGFSSPPPDAAGYRAAPPPPMNEIELAKQKAQEIAARLLNTSDPSKKPRVENGGGGFDSSEASYGFGQNSLDMGPSGLPQGGEYGYISQTKRIEIPNGRVGLIIGKGGETIKYLQMQSGAKIQVTRDMDADPNLATRDVELTGTPDQIAKAEQLVNDVLAEADAAGSGMTSRRGSGQLPGAEQFVMKVANNKVGLVIGKGGETIRNIQASTGARVQVIPLRLPPGDTSKERTVQIDGTIEQIEAAKQMVYEVTSENRMRNPSMSGGGYQTPRPSGNWAPPPVQQQSGYGGYPQPGGGYGGPSPQYNMSQPSYGGYPPPPPQQAMSGWGAPPPPSQGGSYDYYNQQQQQQPTSGGAPPPPSDVTSYGYYGGQYGQDGYGGYHQHQGDASQTAAGGELQKTATSPNPSQSSYGQHSGYSSYPQYPQGYYYGQGGGYGMQQQQPYNSSYPAADASSGAAAAEDTPQQPSNETTANAKPPSVNE